MKATQKCDTPSAVLGSTDTSVFAPGHCDAPRIYNPPRPRVYIAGPITKGDLLHNIDQATAAFVSLAKAGYAPLCPHWSVYSKPAFRFAGKRVYCEATANGNAVMTHADWLGVDLPWVAVADAVLRLPGESSGADQEVAEARRLGIPVYFDLSPLLSEMRANG